MLVLFETSAGFAIFKLLDEKKLSKVDDLYSAFESPERANQVVKLKHFQKFEDTTEALAATTASVEGKVSKPLKKVLKKLVDKDLQDQLLVADAKLGNAIKDKLNLTCLTNNSVQELMRCIRYQLDGLLAGLPQKERTAMTLGLAHSLSRYKLKFSPDKIDTMIIQAVCLLDDLDKELNNYIMRCREWYGWHFPELGKIITDNIAFVKTVRIIGTRENAINSDLSDILPEDLEQKVKEAAEISMGTEITEEDILNIHHLCDEVVEISAYRATLYDYLRARMMAIAPNLTILVGELIGARLISQSGSLINLAKQPSSTVQILGAEKALFRALKTKRDTPKYGLIYHSQIVGMSSTRNKGKISRTLAAKVSLATRYDALGEENSLELGAQHKLKVENRLRLLEEGNNRRISGTAKARAKFEKYQSKSEVKLYPTAQDSTLPSKRTFDEAFGVKEEKVLIEEISKDEGTSVEKKKKKKKQYEAENEETVTSPMKKKKKIKEEQTSFIEEETSVVKEEGEEPKKKKKKRKLTLTSESVSTPEQDTSIKTIKSDTSLLELEDSVGAASLFAMSDDSQKKKKKKKKSLSFSEAGPSSDISGLSDDVFTSPQPKEKKKKKHLVEEVTSSVTVEVETQSGEKKKKKKKHLVEEVTTSVMNVQVDSSSTEKKKKKKKYSES